MPVTDTSWLLALLTPSDEHHGRALQAARRLGNFRIPHVILSELLSTLRFKLGNRAATDAHEWITRNTAFQVVTDSDLQHASSLFRRQPSLGYPDCVAISSAFRAREELLTFDEAQRRAFAGLPT